MPESRTKQHFHHLESCNKYGLRILEFSPSKPVTINQGHNRAFTMSGLTDGWARNIDIFNTVNSVSVTGKRITVGNINIKNGSMLGTKGVIQVAGQDLNPCSFLGFLFF